MSSQPPPPSVPPRPARANQAPSIPPRPVRVKSPATPNSPSPSPSPSPSTPAEPVPTTIAESTALHQPVAQRAANKVPSSRPVPVPGDSQSSSAAPSIYRSATGANGDEYEREQGIPQIGRRVPMLSNAGDVQAPTPSATPSGGRKAHVYREEWEMDEGAYGKRRGETPYSMSSSDLNLAVAQSGTPGMGTGDEQPVPDESFGYLASEEYTRAISRSASPMRPGFDSRDGKSAEDESSVIHLDPASLRPGLFRAGTSDAADPPVDPALPQADGLEPEAEAHEDYPIIAEDEAAKRLSTEHLQPAISPAVMSRPASRRPQSRPQSFIKEDEAPCRGSFEDSRESTLEALEQERAEGDDSKPLFDSDDEKEKEKEREEEQRKPRHSAVAKLKRPDLVEHRFPSNDVWEEAPEHAQLVATVSEPPSPDAEFTEEDRAAARTVPQRQNGEKEPQYVHGQPHHHYEPGDEQEWDEERKVKALGRRADRSEKYLPSDVPDENLTRLLNPNGSGTDTEGNSRSASRSRQHKFPSKDIWEDVPESLDLETTVSPTDSPEKERASTGDASTLNPLEPASAKDRPTTGAPLEGASAAPQSKPEIPARPSIPSRPPQRVHRVPPAEIPAAPARSAFNREPSPEKRAPPSIPVRPKPQIPARPGNKPALPGRTPSSEKTSPAEPPVKEPPIKEERAKPAVPPRTGGKIAALKAGFLGNLENKLKLGPMAPKKETPKDEETPKKEEPLADMRKGRARGPQRRAPTKTAAPLKEKEEVKKEAGVRRKSAVAGPWTVWSVDEDLDAVVVGAAFLLETKVETPPVAAEERLVEKATKEPEAPAAKQDEKEVPEALKPSSPAPEETVPPAPVGDVTALLPGVSGTGDTVVPATAAGEPAKDISESPEDTPKDTAEATPASSESESQPSVAPKHEHANPTLIADSTHPEDAKAPDEAVAAEEQEVAAGKGEEEVVNTPLPSRSNTFKVAPATTLQEAEEQGVLELDKVDEGLKGNDSERIDREEN